MKISETELKQLIRESIKKVMYEQEIKEKKTAFINNIVNDILTEEIWNYGRGTVGREDHFQQKLPYMINSMAKTMGSDIKGIMIPRVDADVTIPINGGKVTLPNSIDYVWVLIPTTALENKINRSKWEKLVTQLIKRVDGFGKGGEYIYDYDYNPKKNLPGGVSYAYFRVKKEPIYVPRDNQNFDDDNI
jgi:hypothetical protein